MDRQSKPGKSQKKHSRFRGVSWHKKDKRWRALLKWGGRFYFLGNYEDEEVAARVWDVVAHVVFGPAARLNFDGTPPLSIPSAEILDRWYRVRNNPNSSHRLLPAP